jgi:undecaprenyl pyrophosphate phosphatase UppP
MPIWQVILLGLIEGVTEFLPVSSTGHLLLTEHFLGICSPGKTFEVLIQLGAILAILSVYAAKLINVAMALPYDERARRFTLGIILAFLPAAVLGALGHSFIKQVLFELEPYALYPPRDYFVVRLPGPIKPCAVERPLLSGTRPAAGAGRRLALF